MNLPLKGLKVIELGRAYAAPWAAQMLGDFGADVIKVEDPRGGDFMRRTGPGFIKDAEGRPTADSGKFSSTNRNKRSVTANIATPEGQEIVRKLLADADVFIENYKVDDLARRGLDYESVRAFNPDIIHLAITGFGQTGPMRSVGTLDPMIQAYSGFMSINGEENGPPLKSNMNVMDLLTGMFGAYAVMMALRHRDSGGGGQFIDLGMFDCGASMMSFLMLASLAAGYQFPRTGSRNVDWVPSGTFPTAGKPIYLAVGTDDDFRRFATAVERPEWLDVPEFMSRSARNGEIERIHALATEALSHDTAVNWVKRLNDVGILAAPIYDFADLVADPQTAARGLMVEAEHAAGGRIPLVRNPILMSSLGALPNVAPPMLGQHTDAVLSELGYCEEERAALRGKGAI